MIGRTPNSVAGRSGLEAHLTKRWRATVDRWLVISVLLTTNTPGAIAAARADRLARRAEQAAEQARRAAVLAEFSAYAATAKRSAPRSAAAPTATKTASTRADLTRRLRLAQRE